MSNEEPIATHIKPSWQAWLWVAVGAVIVPLIVYGLVGSPNRLSAVAIAIFIAMSLACFFAAHASAKWRVNFYADRVEWTGAFQRSRRLFATDIAGLRRTGSTSMRLVPRRGWGAITVPEEALESDVPWLSDLADLDAADRDVMRKTTLSNPRFGATERERATYILRTHLRIVMLTAAGIATAVWAIVWPEPRLLLVIVLIVVPILSLVIAIHSHPVVPIMERGGKLDLTLALLVPTLALFVISTSRVNLIDNLPLAAPVTASAVFATTLAWFDPRIRAKWQSLALLAMFGVLFAGSSVVELNILLDPASPRRVSPVIFEKYVTGGKHVKHMLVVRPWVDGASEYDVFIPNELYEVVAVGDRICIDVHSGALGLRWYDISRCP